MKNLFLRFLPIIFILIQFSCGSSQEEGKTDSVSSEWNWNKIDSADIKLLGSPMIGDVSSDGEKILIYDFPGEEILVTDNSGEIINRWKKNEDTPDSYGFMMGLPGFVGKNQVAIVGMRGFFIYDLQGNLQKKLDHAEAIGGAAFMARPGGSIKTVEINGQTHLLFKSLRGNDSYPGEQAFYDRFKAVELLNIETGEFIPVGKFEEGSRFLDGMGYIESDYMPAYTSDGQNLWLALGNEPIIRQYAIEGDSARLVKSKTLVISEFERIIGRPRSTFDPGSIMVDGSTATIRQLFHWEDKLILSYYTGIDAQTMQELEQIWESGDEEAASAAYEKAEAEVKKGIFILDASSLEVIAEVPYPDNVNTEGFLVANGSIWFEKPASEEVEEDFLRIYQFQLTQE